MTPYFTPAQILELNALIVSAEIAAGNPPTAHGAYVPVYNKLYEFLTDVSIFVLPPPSEPVLLETPKSFVSHKAWMWELR